MTDEPMDILELQSIVARQIEGATGSWSDEIQSARSDLLEQYMAEPYGDEVDDRSSVVDTSISDTVEWILPSLMEVFLGGERVMEFMPVGPEDEELADQETDVVNHVVMGKNKGFLLLYSWFKDALIQKVGYVKRYWDERTVVEIEEFEGLPMAQVSQLFADYEDEGAEVEVLEHALEEPEMPEMLPEMQGPPPGMQPDMQGAQPGMMPDMQPGMQGPPEQGPQGMPPGMPMLPPEPTVSLKLRITRRRDEFRVVNVPPEEFLIAPRWNSLFLDGCPFAAHRRQITRSELIEMGFKRDQVMRMARSQDEDFGDGKTERFSSVNAEENDTGLETDDTMTEILVHEVYVKADYDGDGIAELLRVFVGGGSNEILEWEDDSDPVEQVSSVPFSALCPIPIPHKHYGQSVAELVTDIQRIKTVLTRQMLDNMYLLNNPRPEIAEDMMTEDTIPDLLVSRPGAPIRTATPGGLAFHSPPMFMQQALAYIEYVDAIRENRTGVTKYQQGLDAGNLNKTATGVEKIMSAAQAKVALIARIFAETGVADLMTGVHQDLRKGPVEELVMKLRNKWIQSNPSHWRERTDVTVSVGLGNGDRISKRNGLMLIAQIQEKIAQAVPGVVGPNEIYNTAVAIAENEGFKATQKFFTDPVEMQQQPQQPPPPDPAQILAQAELQGEQMKQQAAMQREQMKLSADMQKEAMRDDRERDKFEGELMLRLAEMQANGETQITIEKIKQMMGAPRQ